MKNLHNTITSLLFVGVLISLVSSCGNQKSSKMKLQILKLKTYQNLKKVINI